MLWIRRVFRSTDLRYVVVALAIAAIFGCSADEPAAVTDDSTTTGVAAAAENEPKTESDTAEPVTAESAADPELATSIVEPFEAAKQDPPQETSEEIFVAPQPSSTETDAAVEPDTEPVARTTSLDERLDDLKIPPPWLEQVQTKYDTSQPWKEARLEIRRLLGVGKPETHREAIKLTWIYLQKNDIGDGHEYPMYTFMGGEPLWSVKAYEWYLDQPHEKAPIHAYLGLAPLYAEYGEFEKAKSLLEKAMDNLPEPPWQIMRKADVLDKLGDVYAAWGKPDEAKRYYAQAIEWYPKAKPPYGGHLLPRRATKVQSKLDLLTFRSLETAKLRDGRYQDRALGYVGDVNVTLVIKDGKMADIQLKHEEKIDQNACTLIPQRILDSQSLQVDGVSGATVTKDAIVNGVYRCLKRAGLK